MQNVKFGFQFGMGVCLARFIWAIPSAMHDPRVKRAIEHRKRKIQKAFGDCQPAKEELTKQQIRTTSAFPQCKNKIGFATNE